MDNKQILKIAALALAFLVVITGLTVVLQGLLLCRSNPLKAGNLQKDWPTYAEATVLDTHTAADSALLLVRQNTGRLWLLEFEKNLVLDRYAMKGDTAVKDGDSLAVNTVRAAYPAAVQGEALRVSVAHLGFDRQELIASYGTIWLLLAVASLALWRKLKK